RGARRRPGYRRRRREARGARRNEQAAGQGAMRQPHESRGRAAERSISGRIADSSHARFIVRNRALQPGVADEPRRARPRAGASPPDRTWAGSPGSDDRRVAYLWAVNGVGSVLGAGLTLMLSLLLGGHLVLLAGSALYLLAWTIDRREAIEGQHLHRAPSRRALPGGARAALAPATSRAGRGGVAPERAANRDLGLIPRRQGLEARRRQLGELLARTHGDVEGVAEPAKVLFALLHAHEHLGSVVGAR